MSEISRDYPIGLVMNFPFSLKICSREGSSEEGQSKDNENTSRRTSHLREL